MIVAASYLSLVALVLVSMWIAWVRGRGAIGYWIRPLTRDEGWAIGIELDADSPADQDQQRLGEVVALVRTLGRESGHVLRQWDREAGKRFVGLMLTAAPDDPPKAPYELRHLPAAPVLRLSGKANEEGQTPSAAVEKFAESRDLGIDLAHSSRISGQSFSFYQWDITPIGEVACPKEPLAERIFRLRDIVLFPVMMTFFSIALIGTQNGGLFAVGILALIFLSGATKFVFVHQREDESQESHLQNY